MTCHVMMGLGAPRIVYQFPDRGSLRAFLVAWREWRAAAEYDVTVYDGVHDRRHEPPPQAYGGSYASCPYIVEDVDDAGDVVLMLEAEIQRYETER